jgi:Hypothetical glycosyl hydrolase family 15
MHERTRRRVIAGTWRRLSHGLALLTALAICWVLPGPAVGEAAVAKHFCLVLNTPAVFSDPARTARRNAYVVLQAWEVSRARQLEAANPRLIVLVYQDLSAMAQGTNRDGLSSSGINFAEADIAHPGWFLREADGERIAEEGYDWLWMADIGVPGYQRRWTSNVLHILSSGPWDGVFIDDANTTAKYHVKPVSRIARYPTDAAYQGAVGSMLAYAGPRIRAAGKLAIPNMGAWAEYPQVVEGWLRFVDGGMDQQFVKWSPVPGKGYVRYSRWRSQLREVQTTEKMGKRFLAVTSVHSGDTRALRFGWASVLLGASGHTAFFARGAHDGETWSPEYEVPLGRPTSRASRGGGVWRRSFAMGLVVVNPTRSTLKVSFRGLYGGSGLQRARGAYMKPHTALILVRQAARRGLRRSRSWSRLSTPLRSGASPRRPSR